MRRWVKVSVAVAVVLAGGGYVAEPHVREWMVIRNACGGTLPRDAVEQLVPEDSRLESEESRRTEGLDSYSCGIAFEGGDRFVSMSAYTRRDDQDREFMTVFPEGGFSAQAPLPEDLPGFTDDYGTTWLRLPCPDLDKDDNGRARTLLVRATLGRDVRTEVPGAAYRTTVALANSASDALGCGTEPLKASKRDVPLIDASEDPETVPLAEAKGTACEWVTRAGLPERGNWRIAVHANNAAPSGMCDLYAQYEDTSDNDTRLAFASWYGDWSNRLAADDNNGERWPMTATARCDGEAANYALSASDDIPGVGEAAERRMLKEFAADEVRRRGCSDLTFRF